MIERVGGGEIWRCQIVIPIGHEYFQRRVQVDRQAQGFRYIKVLVLVLLVTPRSDAAGEDLIREIALKIQLLADVLVKYSGERPLDRCVARVKFITLACRIPIQGFKTRVQSANSLPFVPQKLLGKPMDLYPQIGAI